MAFPSWLRSSRPDAALHPGWRRLLDGMTAVGLGQELEPDAVLRLIPPSAIARAPEGEWIAALLDGYYRARDRGPKPGESGRIEIDASMRRCRRDRYVGVREQEGTTARNVVAKLRLAVPELGGLALVEEPQPRFVWASNLVLRARGGVAPIPVAALELEPVALRDGTYVRRTVPVRALLSATNAILSKRGIAWRFLPIESPDGVEAYLALTRDQALFVEPFGLFLDPLESLQGLAAWKADLPGGSLRGAPRSA